MIEDFLLVLPLFVGDREQKPSVTLLVNLSSNIKSNLQKNICKEVVICRHVRKQLLLVFNVEASL